MSASESASTVALKMTGSLPFELDLLRKVRPVAKQHGFSPAEVSDLMQGIYQRGDRIMLGFLVAHTVLALGLAAYHQTWASTIVVSAFTLGGFALLVRVWPRTLFTRSMASVAQQAFVALHIYQMHGQPEQHFWFFTALTMMIVYQDWVCMWPGTLLIILQHVVFAYLTNLGYHAQFFPEHHVDFTKLLFHFGIAIVHVAMCGYWAVLLRGQTLSEAWQRLQLTLAGDRLSKELEHATESERAIAAQAQELRESADRQHAILASIPDLAWVKDVQGRFTAVNRAFTRFVGRDASAIIGARERDVLPTDADQAARADREAIEERRIVRCEERHIDHAGRMVDLETIRAPIIDERGSVAGTTGIARDVSERKRAADEALRMQSNLQEAQRLESLGLLAGGVAHDFNNLLTVILANAEFAAQSTTNDCDTQGSVSEIRNAAQRAAELTRQMLAYSGRAKFAVQPIDLSAVVSEMASLLASVISKKATVRYDLAEGLPFVEGDATQIGQVVMNLLTNASDALGDGAGEIQLSTGVEGPFVFVRVSDTGHGMDAETVQRVFDPFFTTKFTGRGLGLASVQGIVRSHGGTIQVTSRPGEGSAFRVLLPAMAKGAVAGACVPTPVAESASDRAGDGRTILLADDEPQLRATAARTLTRAGYSVITAKDGKEALDLFRLHRADVSVVLLDMTMPTMNGAEACLAIRELAPQIPVILCSGYAADEVAGAVRNLTDVSFLAKPYLAAELCRQVAASAPGGALSEYVER
jgi:PAS domain S-box-containing protein